VPVAFVGFEARGVAGGVELQWAVIDAIDVEGYNVYRSSDGGATYLKISGTGSLPAGISSYFDTSAQPGQEYTYRIGALDLAGEIFSIPARASARVVTARLDQNTPNPFNPVTTITFVLPEAQVAHVRIYDTQGKLVTTLFSGRGTRGENRLTWDGTNTNGLKVGSGVYFYKLVTEKFTETRKMVLLK
jgi:hypothetical protein